MDMCVKLGGEVRMAFVDNFSRLFFFKFFLKLFTEHDFQNCKSRLRHEFLVYYSNENIRTR